MKRVMIRYTLKAGTDLEAFEAEIQGFVAKMHAFEASFHYTSFALGERGKDYAHVGIFPDVDRLAELQAQDFFGAFAAFLNSVAQEGPSVTPLSQVASTHD